MSNLESNFTEREGDFQSTDEPRLPLGQIEILEPRKVPLGGTRAMNVRRTLPQRDRSLIGAWCFLDHYGPDEITDDRTMQVPPHPHTGLQTVSWLFEGEIEHRDSTGENLLVRPGELNLMTAGSGVQHSEYVTPRTTRMHGVQLWVAIPDRARDEHATFENHLASQTTVGEATAQVFIGSFAGASSEATTYTPLVAVQLDIPAGGEALLPLERSFEHGVLVDRGDVRIDDVPAPRDALAYVPPDRDTLHIVTGAEPARLVLIGGVPFAEKIVMWWNFVGRSHEEIVEFRDQWQAAGDRFGTINDPNPRLPAPPLPTVRLRPRNQE